MSHVTMKTLPSNYIPYPEGSQVKSRPILYGEAYYFSENAGNEYDIIRKFKDDEIIICEGFEFEDLTLGDWLFCLLSVMSSSHMQMTYNISRPCSKCKGEIKTLELQVKDGETKEMQIKGNVKADLTPAEIHFRSIDNTDIESTPVIVDTEDGEEAEVDFYRLKHYFESLENKSKDELSQVVSNIDVTKLSLDDVQVISYARSIMDHGPEPEVEARCPACGNTEVIQVSWEGIDFVPFRIDEGSAKRRIRFGKRAKSTVGKSKESSVSSRSKPIPELNKVSGENSAENEE